ncbi:HAD-IA family hydrolase [Rhodobacterales bacterium HKCCE3408]|nr:HAD-IA family hydrolase [Rhodobacterales bacterium HKCCE3408]
MRPGPALLFDLDGTMLDSDPIHRAVFAEMLAPHGFEVTEAFYRDRIHGRLNADLFAELMPDGGDPRTLSETKEAAFRDRLPKPYPAMPGVVDLVGMAVAKDWPRAVVTNAMRLNAEAMLAAIGLDDAFEIVISGEECPAGKPAPDPYLAALDALGLAADRTIAFEDSPSGVASARAAGAYTVGIASSLPPDDLHAHGAQAVLTDFTDPALAAILARFTGVPA